MQILEPSIYNSKADHFVMPNQYANYIGCDGLQLVNALWKVVKKGTGVVFEGKRQECINYCKTHKVIFNAMGINSLGAFMYEEQDPFP